MQSGVIQALKKELLPAVEIFVENDAFAFFDVKEPTLSPGQEADKWFGKGDSIEKAEMIDVEKIKYNPFDIHWKQPYNFLVDENCIRYFRRGNYEGRLWTVSVTTPCIVFCAYTNEDARTKPSGVYHFCPPYPHDSSDYKRRLTNNLSNLVDTVRRTEGEEVIVKGIGGDCDKLSQQEIRDVILKTLNRKGLKAKPSHFMLGEGYDRITEFHPNINRLVTYFDNSEDRTVL